jgi:hypothetical protein
MTEQNKLVGWLLHLCYNNFLKMAPGCRNLHEFFTCVMYIASRSAFVGKYIDDNNCNICYPIVIHLHTVITDIYFVMICFVVYLTFFCL